MDKNKIVKGIRTCNEMGVLWHNGYTPGKSFHTSVKEIAEVLNELLDVKYCECDNKKKKK